MILLILLTKKCVLLDTTNCGCWKKNQLLLEDGHNNAYGIIKGCALALNKSMNVINFDAHTDLRKLEGRHSGNGFSYAYEEGFLKKYYVFGLHENYTPKTIFKNMKAQPEIFQYATFEELYTRREKRSRL